jgi:hypothetical protein
VSDEEQIGCADNSCIFRVLRGPGVGTNGGCRCFKNLVCFVENEARSNRDEVRKVERDTMRLRARVSELKEALHRYGDHDSECYQSRNGGECVCGLAAALGEAR